MHVNGATKVANGFSDNHNSKYMQLSVLLVCMDNMEISFFLKVSMFWPILYVIDKVQQLQMFSLGVY